MPAAKRDPGHKKINQLTIYAPELAGKKPAKKPTPTEADRVRWVMYKAHGKPIEEIAALMNCGPIEVQRSINEMENYQQYYSVSALETKTIETVMNQMDGVGKVFNDGLKANKTVPNGQGKTKSVTDWSTRIKTVETIKNLIETVRPRSPNFQLNQQINSGASSGGQFTSGMSFESLLRKKREQYGLANEQEVDVIEAEVSHEDSVADEFAEFGGNEDGDGEEGDDACPA